jgi:hypothetical protein
MKKIITLCFFAFAMILGSQTVAAQSMVEINSLAAKKTQELKKAVKFDSETEEMVYKTYQAYAQKKFNVDKSTDNGNTVSAEDREKIENMVAEKFKSIFTEAEFKRYLDFADMQK